MSDLDQLNHILNILGSPTPQDLQCIINEKVRFNIMLCIVKTSVVKMLATDDHSTNVLSANCLSPFNFLLYKLLNPPMISPASPLNIFWVPIHHSFYCIVGLSDIEIRNALRLLQQKTLRLLLCCIRTFCCSKLIKPISRVNKANITSKYYRSH